MCNLYTTKSSAAEVASVFRARDLTGNMPWQTDVYPDREAPIIRTTEDGPVIARARWGMPSPERFHSKSGRDAGVTNIRNTPSPHWTRWLKRGHRCLVPVEQFSEPGADKKPVWFAPSDGAPMMFAGIHVQGWKSLRKVKDGETVDDLFGFLTCAPNAEVAEIHPKAMPVILRTAEEWQAWLTLPWAEAKLMQRPLPDGALRRV